MEDTNANSAIAQFPPREESERPAPPAWDGPTASPSVGASALFHDALRACLDAHTALNVSESADPDYGAIERRADQATGELIETLDGLFARRLALATSGEGEGAGHAH